MLKLALISDDLTGALDAAVVFAARGLRALVAVSGDKFAEALGSGADIVAVSLNTREGTDDAAFRLTEAAAKQVPRKVAIFKKIDSRMKGHIRAEVEAAALAYGAREVKLCPAIPSMNRFVAGGKVVGSGIDDPIILADYSGKVASDLFWSFPDAKTEADLDAIANGATSETLLCGARGLAGALARKLGPNVPIKNFNTLPLLHPMLIAIGSRDPITLVQVEALRDRAPNMAFVVAPNGLVENPELPHGDLILQTVPGREEAPSKIVTRNFASLIGSRVAPGRATLVLTGGETAAETLACLGIGILEIVGEPIEGMPASVPFGKKGPVIVTKSGGFGAADALVRLAGLQKDGKA